MTSGHRDPEGRSLKLTRRRLLRLAGGGALAASSGGWLANALHASGFPYSCAPQPGCLAAFNPPAGLSDFPAGSAADAALRRQWNLNVNQFTEQAILGSAWGSNVDSPRRFYFNPLRTPIPEFKPGAKDNPVYKLVEWTAFPNRVTAYLGDDFSQEEIFELADNGRLKNGTTLPTIPENVCPSIGLLPGPEEAFGPYGPRGWQDEYNEWAVERRADGEIRRVIFTSENPEYWHTLWSVSPEKVVQLYQWLVNPNVRLEHLLLTDRQGNPIRDQNGDLVYNPLNRWNTGTELLPHRGGAVHLTSPPNNLSAEIDIGAAATVLRIDDNGNPQDLICCSEYGQNFRHSDPHIGFTINQAVNALKMPLTVTDPVGLYMQWPDFQNVELPPDMVRAGLTPYDFWHWKRFAERPPGQPGVMGLHAEFRAPRGYENRKLSEIRIDGRPLRWGSQIATTFQIGLVGVLIPAGDRQPEREMICISAEIPAPERIAPQFLLSCDVALAQIAAGIPTESYSANPVTHPGTRLSNMALLLAGGSIDTRVQFLVRHEDGSHSPAEDITVTTHRFIENQPIPIGGITNILVIDIDVGPNAPLGQLDLRLGSEYNPAGPGFLTVERRT